MKSIKRFMAIMLVICLLCSMSQVFAVDSTVTIQFKGTQNYNEAYAVLDLVNQYRAEEGLPALKMDEELMAAAMQRAAECSIYFSHTRPDGTSCFTVFPSKFTYGSRAENIAIGQGSATAVMNSWMNSPGHYGNIMDSSFTTIGIGCFYQDGILSWVQLFSSRSGTAPSTQPDNTTVTASVDALPNNLQIVCGLEKTDKPNHYNLYMYNRNIEFSYEYIELSNNDISFSSSDNSIIKVTNGTLLEEVGVGTAILRGYINGVQVFEADYTVESIAHEHVYDAVVTPPTCTTGGYTTYTCSICGDSYIGDTTNIVPHNYDVVVTPPTCAEGGFTTYTCPDCGKTYVDDETDSLPHNYNAVVTPPTCTDVGFTTYTCKDCGETYIDDETAPLSHSYNAVVTPPTCTDVGFTTYTCKDCGETFLDDETAPLPHNYNTVVTPPTCTDVGFTTYTCKDCGETFIDDETGPIPHDYTTTVIAPTQTSEGYTIYDCKNCEYYFHGDFTDPLPVTPPSEYVLGDANGDGEVDNIDLVAIARHIVGIEIQIDLIAADIDKSNDITNSDLISVARYIVGLE